MIDRPLYINQLLSLKDKHITKILTGVRRSGKSTLFDMMQAKLLETGVAEEQIISINLEDPDWTNLLNWKKLYNHVKARLLPNKKNYVFLDEIQNVEDFQRAADGLFIKKNVDLYLTGSNSKNKAGEWATMLSGRYVEISILPLSFKEYISAVGTDNLQRKFGNYLENSSFPQALEFDSRDDIQKYLAGIYNTILLKDVAESLKIRNISRLERILKFMADNIGKETSANNISKAMTADGVKINERTVESYLKAFCDSHILYRADRYDVKGKKLLKTLNKYYMVDVGLRYLLLGDRRIDTGRMLENIVYLELLRRNRRVYVGKINTIRKTDKDTGEEVVAKEIDFVVEGKNGTEYYQVAETALGQATLARELASLNAVKDHNPKFLLTMDYLPKTSHNGIKQLNILDWLLKTA
ncbi:MAG: ATP-binding protein [Candidatus Fibromonas sp.]|jgi:predicted AAA+ superfamily ATPase|nr:ATP-binding protein [Candidatus Fibromonas sp.]